MNNSIINPTQREVSAPRWLVAPLKRDRAGRIRRYSLRWTGEPLGYLYDGHTMGSYLFKHDAVAHAERLNKTLGGAK